MNKQIEHYLRTGEYDQDCLAWPGEGFFARARHGHAALLEALIAEVLQRTPGATMPGPLIGMDVAAFTRARVAPMVCGLFPQGEREAVLGMLSRTVVFPTPANIDSVLRKSRWLHTAWKLANLYLASFGMGLLSDEAPLLVGLSEGITCYVSADHFREKDPFADFVAHEAAHIFHNCKRETLGLRKIRGREWLLEVGFAKREMFAYACEAYSLIQALGKGRADRRRLLSELGQASPPPDDRVDADEYIDILREAIEARNGWKRILERCHDRRPVRRHHLGAD